MSHTTCPTFPRSTSSFKPHSTLRPSKMSDLPDIASTIHFVGSICLPDTPAVFDCLCSSLPSRLRRIPDGETGKRHNFVSFQREVFHDSPFVQAPFPPGAGSGKSELDARTDAQPIIKLLPLEYDDFAIAGYHEFCKLRNEAIIPKGVRFQVSLPSPVNVVGNVVEPCWRAQVEPLYEAALLAALERIQDEIPAHDLAVQWDLASEFAYLEGAVSSPLWFGPAKGGLVDRIVKLAAGVREGVQLGFHLCYGDLGHRHFVEPRDTALLVDFAGMLLGRVERRVDWLHMPVPKGRVDAAYFEPLKGLRMGGTELYLGLLHAGDEEGTRKRVVAAAEFIGPFGLATECGLGRSSRAELESVLDIAKKVTGAKA